MKHMNETFTNGIARQLGFEKYIRIISDIDPLNNIFQVTFNDYYKVRRDANWRTVYYKCFSELKDKKDITFDEIITYLYDNLPQTEKGKNRVEASFASKMLATINPSMPILDSQVLINMGLMLSDSNDTNKKLRTAISVYEEMIRRYDEYQKADECKEAISLFNTYFPSYSKLSATKKIDFFLWGMTRTELHEMGLFEVLINECH